MYRKSAGNWIILAAAAMLLSLGFVAADTPFYDEYPYPRDRFANPLGIDWRLSGTFGEPRANHFHAGTDVRTNGASGYRLYAIDDGHIARIKVSPYGYGKALYIDHAGGYTSVYGHMSAFSDAVDALIRARQYAEESFEQDIYLDAGFLNVKKGEVIGLSGNSGGSAGPHLHFEIRETATQRPLNPLFFGYAVEDTRSPQLMGVKLTGFHGSFYHVAGKKEAYYAAGALPDTIEFPAGRLALGVHSLDQQSLSYYRNGVFRVELTVDGAAVFKASMAKLDFSTARYVHAFRDYDEYRSHDRTVYNCYRLPGNELDVYEQLVNDGFIDLRPGAVHNIRIDVWDFHRNRSTATFIVRGTEPIAADEPDSKENSKGREEVIPYDVNYQFENADFRISIPAGTFYDDVPLVYERRLTRDPSVHSAVHQLQDMLIPMHKYAVVQVGAPSVPGNSRSKAVMMHRDLKGAEQSLTTFWKNGMVSARAREVGQFYVKIDSVAPEIRLVNYNSKYRTFRGSQIRVHIDDDMAGVHSYNGYIDGQWVVFDYDAKRNLLIYDFDEHCPPGEHNLEMVVTDGAANKTVKAVAFFAP